jgi:hypothetical protein
VTRLAPVVLFCLVLSASPAVAGTPSPSPALQSYQDPDKLFTMGVPAGWKVRRFPNGSTTFYVDDPEEGTAFSIIPALSLKGEMDASQVLGALLPEYLKRWPDFKVVGQKQRAVQGNPRGTIVDAAFLWTNSKKVVMKGWATLGATKISGEGRTVITSMGYQAASKDFDGLEPVFDAMLKSLKFGKGR